MQLALPLLPDGAAIVINGSMWTVKGIAGFGVLSATKATVRSFARTWANELRARRICVNVVSPGLVHTPAIEAATAGATMRWPSLTGLRKTFRAGRVAWGDEIAKAVVFLASDDASFVNGAELFVDGGMV